MYIRYVGHSCFSLEGSRKVLIDPMPEAAASVDADLVLVTHAHGDHLGITVDLKKQTVAIHELANYLSRKGVPAVGMNIGGTYAADGVKVTCEAYCALLEAFQQKVTAAVPLANCGSSSAAWQPVVAFRLRLATMLLGSSRDWACSGLLPVGSVCWGGV